MNQSPNNLTRRYDGITRYAGVPTEQETGRLHYNENLYGPSPRCMDTLRQTSFNDLCLYESGSHDDLTDALSEKFGVPVGCIFTGNGSAENLRSIMNIFTKPGDTVLLPDPGWSYYTGLADCRFLKVEKFPIVETAQACVFDENDIRQKIEALRPAVVVIASPAMPTGNSMPDDMLEGIVRDFPDTLIVVDEAYYGFRPYTLDVARMVKNYDNVLFSRTFSKY
ncbi:MAG: aminotransferase class I/II-fold pyridoxal phosphate-dependent enzyme, partial [Clostridia bacterium]|nr:aminotransferase class I/II-fold pyridoxal phosphate-dependent enzyme [Clostridia bacterium]